MKLTLIIALFSLASCFSGYAQSGYSEQLPLPSGQDSLPRGKYEIGINTYFAFDRLFEQSVRSPFELLIRKRLSSPSQMIRMRVFGDLLRSRKVEFTNTDETQNVSYGVALGYEWIRQMAPRWQGYYGLELEGNRSGSFLTHTANGYEPGADPEVFWEKTHTYQHTESLAFSPLAGIRFLLSKRLLFSTEFRMVNSLEWNKSGKEYATKPMEGEMDYQIQTQDETRINQRGIRFKPYTGIFLNYRF